MIWDNQHEQWLLFLHNLEKELEKWSILVVPAQKELQRNGCFSASDFYRSQRRKTYMMRLLSEQGLSPSKLVLRFDCCGFGRRRDSVECWVVSVCGDCGRRWGQ